jgi:hypothetical protein
MNKILTILLCGTLTVAYVSNKYPGDTLAPVVLAGSIIKHAGTEIPKKYQRKDCPVCKGKGWYLSGDSIEKVPCGYCEPESKSSELKSCGNTNCRCKTCNCKKCGCLPSVE